MKSSVGFPFSCVLVLASFGAAAQGNRSPSDVTCAATFSVPPTSQASNPNYDRMQQYFQALVNLKMSPDQGEAAISAEISRLSKMSLEARMSMSRSCGIRYLNENTGRILSPKIT